MGFWSQDLWSWLLHFECRSLFSHACSVEGFITKHSSRSFDVNMNVLNFINSNVFPCFHLRTQGCFSSSWFHLANGKCHMQKQLMASLCKINHTQEPTVLWFSCQAANFLNHTAVHHVAMEMSIWTGIGAWFMQFQTDCENRCFESHCWIHHCIWWLMNLSNVDDGFRVLELSVWVAGGFLCAFHVVLSLISKLWKCVSQVIRSDNFWSDYESTFFCQNVLKLSFLECGECVKAQAVLCCRARGPHRSTKPTFLGIGAHELAIKMKLIVLFGFLIAKLCWLSESCSPRWLFFFQRYEN